MIDYIKGQITELSPTEVILETYGIGYRILISLQTYESLNGRKDSIVYIHHYLREDEELYYGFASKDERELFRLLIGVSGIGASTARMMLSSMSSEEIRTAILAEDINKIKSIKGIGMKSARNRQRTAFRIIFKCRNGRSNYSPGNARIHQGKRNKSSQLCTQGKAFCKSRRNNKTCTETPLTIIMVMNISLQLSYQV